MHGLVLCQNGVRQQSWRGSGQSCDVQCVSGTLQGTSTETVTMFSHILPFLFVTACRQRGTAVSKGLSTNFVSVLPVLVPPPPGPACLCVMLTCSSVAESARVPVRDSAVQVISGTKSIG